MPPAKTRKKRAPALEITPAPALPEMGPIRVPAPKKVARRSIVLLDSRLAKRPDVVDWCAEFVHDRHQRQKVTRPEVAFSVNAFPDVAATYRGETVLPIREGPFGLEPQTCAQQAAIANATSQAYQQLRHDVLTALQKGTRYGHADYLPMVLAVEAALYKGRSLHVDVSTFARASYLTYDEVVILALAPEAPAFAAEFAGANHVKVVSFPDQ